MQGAAAARTSAAALDQALDAREVPDCFDFIEVRAGAVITSVLGWGAADSAAGSGPRVVCMRSHDSDVFKHGQQRSRQVVNRLCA